jgi:hypothetical protein
MSGYRSAQWSMERAKVRLQTPDAYEAWLRTKKPEAVVGEVKKCAGCPLARYLWELGAPSPEVFRTCWRASVQDDFETNPQWMMLAVQVIDRWGRPSAEVTAADALDLLRIARRVSERREAAAAC